MRQQIDITVNQMRQQIDREIFTGTYKKLKYTSKGMYIFT